MAKKESYRNVRTANYTQISNDFLNDPEASLQAKGLLSIFLSNTNDWEIHMAEIINRSKNGRDTHYKVINELINLGYFSRIAVSSSLKNNRFEEMIYIFSDIKSDVEKEIDRLKCWAMINDKKLTIEYLGKKERFPQKEKESENLDITPFPEIQDTGNQYPESQDNNNTNNKKTNKKNTKSINHNIVNIDDDKRTSSIEEDSQPMTHNEESIQFIINNFRESTKDQLSDLVFNAVVRKVIDKYNQGKINSFRDYLATSLVNTIKEIELQRLKGQAMEHLKEDVKKRIQVKKEELMNQPLRDVPFYNWLLDE